MGFASTLLYRACHGVAVRLGHQPWLGLGLDETKTPLWGATRPRGSSNRRQTPLVQSSFAAHTSKIWPTKHALLPPAEGNATRENPLGPRDFPEETIKQLKS